MVLVVCFLGLGLFRTSFEFVARVWLWLAGVLVEFCWLVGILMTGLVF